MANLIPQIAEMLGVELSEKFEIKGYKGLVYKFVDDELIVNSTDDKGCSGLTANMTLVSLLKGKREIVKLPWKPEEGENYYTFIYDCYHKWCVWQQRWSNHPFDLALLEKGWVFRTQEEAEDALPKVAAEIGVDYEL